MGLRRRIACPDAHQPNAEILANGHNAQRVQTASEAVADADLVVTDVWSSMGHEGQEAQRREIFEPYQVNEALLDQAKSDVLFMHCLPAHRGEEVSATYSMIRARLYGKKPATACTAKRHWSSFYSRSQRR